MYLPEACLFDLDGLLIDTEPLHGKAWAHAASHFGANLNKTQLIQLRGRRRLDCAKQILSWIDNKEVEVEELIEIQQSLAKKLLCNAKAIPCAEELIKWCVSKEIPMALVTSSTANSVQFKSTPHPWLNLIKTRVFGDDPNLNKGKPFPDPFLLAAKKLNSNPKHCWALEDSPSGTKSALAAGCQVWVLSENIKESFMQGKSLDEINNPQNITSLEIVLNQLKILASI